MSAAQTVTHKQGTTVVPRLSVTAPSYVRCWECREWLDPETSIVRKRSGRGFQHGFQPQPICVPCFVKAHRGPPPSPYYEKRSCRACSRVLYVEISNEWMVSAHVCGRACAQRIYRRERREARSPRSCVVCGESFDARGDAKTCSARCRKRLSRSTFGLAGEGSRP